MKLPIIKAENVSQPLKGYGFAFIDSEDKKLKIKKHDSIIEFSNTLDDVQLLDLSDYTAFEVYPTNHDIAVGEVDPVTNLVYSYAISAQMTEKFIIRTNTPQVDQDIIVDWGDGIISSVKNGDFESTSNNDFTMSHTYSEEGRYIVKIYGKQYYAFKYSGTIQNYNLMSRCLDIDLPVASHLTNLSSFCYYALRLQKVNVPRYAKYLSNVLNTSSMFNFCKNLITVSGFSTINPSLYSCGSMFGACLSLTACDFKLPAYITSNNLDCVFEYCSSLAVDINTLLPTQNFQVDSLNVNKLFANSGITGTIPGDKLWNNKKINWTDTSTVFLNCSDEIRAQVPVSWGGTASDDLIEPTLEEKYAALLARVEALESK